MPGHTEHLNRLVDEVGELEDLGAAVQDTDDQETALSLLRELRDRYHDWQARARLLIPGDRKEEFEGLFEGTTQSWRIEKYLAGAREASQVDLRYIPPESRAYLSKWQCRFEDSFQKPLIDQKRILLDARARILIGGETVGILEFYANLFGRLPRTVSALRKPARSDREPVYINDEYDLQRVMHAILNATADDVVAEEGSPSRLGSSPRIDFVVRDKAIAIEAKYVHESTTKKKLGSEVTEDIKRYVRHPDVSGILFVVYDPENRLDSPRGFEKDADDVNAFFPVRLVVA